MSATGCAAAGETAEVGGGEDVNPQHSRAGAPPPPARSIQSFPEAPSDHSSCAFRTSSLPEIACSYYSRITILVNRGFVPRRKVNPDTRHKGQVRVVDCPLREELSQLCRDTASRTFPHRSRERWTW